MKRLTNLVLATSLFLLNTSMTACSDDTPQQDLEIPETPGNEGSQNQEDMQTNRNIIITVYGTPFNATLADNDAARAFAAMLPVTMQMSELNGNEKYYYLDSSIPTESYTPGTINTGDIMLYGSSCVVIFYETFSSGYSYTRLGMINNPEGLADAAGSSDAIVSFAIAEDGREQ